MTAVEMSHEEMTHKVQLLYALNTLVDRGVVTEAGCFEWTGALNSRGYGVISVGGKRELTVTDAENKRRAAAARRLKPASS